MQVKVLGAHEAARQRTDRERRQGRADRRVLGDDDLELLGRQAHDRRLGRRLAREERILRAGQRHQANERARRRQVRKHLALRGIPVQGHLPVKHQVHGTHRLTLRDQLRALRDDESRTLAEHPLDAREELHNDLALVTVQALQERTLDGERRRIRDEVADLALRIAAPAQVTHHRRIRLARQQRHRPGRLQHRGQRPRLHASREVTMLGLIRDDHPLHACQHGNRRRILNHRVNVGNLRGHQTHQHMIAGAQARLVGRQVPNAVHSIQAQARERVRQVPGYRGRDMPRIVTDHQHMNRVPRAMTSAAHIRARHDRGILLRGPLRPPVGQPRPGATVRARADHGLVHGHVTSPR